MFLIERQITAQLLDAITPNKVVVLLGPRRVGKTVLLKQIIAQRKEDVLLLNGEDFSVRELLRRRSVAHYKNMLGNKRILVIDEAQKIPEIGHVLKLMVDEIKGLSVFVTGSSAFDMRTYTGEPLTGRKKTFYLFPFSEAEYRAIEDPVESIGNLRHRLVYGNYPELLHLKDQDEKAHYLQEIVNDYLLKDILAFENIRNADKILALLRLIAFQVGTEVSYGELGRQLSMSKNTVEKYLDLLAKVYVLFKVGGFSRNLRKEVTKSSKWYFYDNGLRNVITANMNPVELRNDVGQLWENYIISERIKYQTYNRLIVNNYFWRTYDQQEIDWVEERKGTLYAYEMTWNEKKRVKVPGGWKKAYPASKFKVITPLNYGEWVV